MTVAPEAAALELGEDADGLPFEEHAASRTMPSAAPTTFLTAMPPN